MKSHVSGDHVSGDRISRDQASGDHAAATVFLPPEHDHTRCSTDAMAIAEARCRERDQRLTPIRRQVLAALLASHRPLGAYEIMDQLLPRGPRPAPITVYRALEFLRDNGLVHRIESRNAFIACVHNHAAADLVVFMICERCGAVGEAASDEVAHTLSSAARAAGFTPKSPVLEITGVCGHCKDKVTLTEPKGSGTSGRQGDTHEPVRST